MTSMYDAEFGRASGAIVNAVTKAGTDQFKGVAVLSQRQCADRQRFLGEHGNLKPTRQSANGAPCLAGRCEEQGILFYSLERQVDNPNRTRVFQTPPEFNFRSPRTGQAGTHCRFDHQITQSHTWAVR